MKRKTWCVMDSLAVQVIFNVTLTSLGLVACEPEPDSDPGGRFRERVSGSWTWVQSKGGYADQFRQPPFEGKQYVIEFSTDGSYREYEDTRPVVETTFSLRKEPVFHNTDTLVVHIGNTRFFTLFSPDSAFAVAVRGDTLELIGTTSDAWYHRFRRLK